ncbi:MAG TPA: GTP 3',8-cyclase MoaA [Bacteroidia bacterium]|nr:GTP 3',8-cyclase MoaA [Bacteroidia bacterium]
MLKDSFGRIHDYLRIGITDRCNYRCLYCLPEPEFSHGCNSAAKDMMTVGEIEAIAAVFVKAGVRKIRITGGEPLVRKDAGEIIEQLGNLGVQLAITTNGSRIDAFIESFSRARLKSVNVSLDSLNASTFSKLTNKNDFEKVYANINLLLSLNYHVKVNMVVMNGYNDHEIADFVEWTRNTPIHIRFIEFMPFPGNHWKPEKLMTYKEILKSIEYHHPDINKLEDHPNDTTKKYQVKGYAGTFAVISTMSEPFCSGCNRLRLTADGKMRNCLFSKTETDLLTPFREGVDILPLIQGGLAGKHFKLGGNTDADWGLKETVSDKRSMMGIGG